MAVLTHKKRPGRVRRLSEIEAEEVSIVDRPANKRRFLVIKYEDGSTDEVEISMDTAHDPTNQTPETSEEVPAGGTTPDATTSQASQASVAADSAASTTPLALSKDAQAALLQPVHSALSRLAALVKAVQEADTTADGATLPSAVSEELAAITKVLAELGSQDPTTVARLQEVASQALLASNTLDLDEGAAALKKTAEGLSEVAEELEATASELQPDQVEALNNEQADVTLPAMLRQVSERASRAADILTEQTATSKAAAASEVSELLGLVKAIEEVEIEKAAPGKRLAKVVRDVAARALAMANTLVKAGGAPNGRMLRSVKSLLTQLERAAERYPAAKSDDVEDPNLPEDVQKAAGMIARILQEISEKGTALAEKIEMRDGGPSKAHVRSVGSLLRKLRGLVSRFPSASAAKGEDSDAETQGDDDTPAAQVAPEAPAAAAATQETAEADAAASTAAPNADEATQAAKAADAEAAAAGDGDTGVDDKKDLLEDIIAKAVKAALVEAGKGNAAELAAVRAELASVKKGVQAPATSPAAGDTPASSGKAGEIPEELLFPGNYNDPDYRAELEKRGIAW